MNTVEHVTRLLYEIVGKRAGNITPSRSLKDVLGSADVEWGSDFCEFIFALEDLYHLDFAEADCKGGLSFLLKLTMTELADYVDANRT